VNFFLELKLEGVLIDNKYQPITTWCNRKQRVGIVGAPYHSEDIKKYSLNLKFMFVVFYKPLTDMVR
jgi:hypothetical protein